MEIIKINRAEHPKYGLGWVIEDVEGDCKDYEVLFMPDGGVFDRTNCSSLYAHFVPAKFDIFNKDELFFN